LAKRAKTALQSPWTVAILVSFLYGVWLVGSLRAGQDVRDFMHLGTSWVQRSEVSSVIKFDPAYRYDGDIGYDGQFFYFIAADPVHARYYLDDSSYRYGRILYPLTARLLALGKADLIPYTLLALNWLAIGVGTYAVAQWLRRKGVFPGFALVFGLYPGLHIALQRDTSEATSYALVAVAIYLFDFGKRFGRLGAALAFALAILARETALLFALPYGLSLLLQGGHFTWRTRLLTNWRQVGAFTALTLGPYVLYKGFLRLWLGSFGRPPDLQTIPFRGILYYQNLTPGQVEEYRTVIFPALICLAVALWALTRRLWSREVAVLLVNILVLVVFLPAESYIDVSSAGRIATGVVLAALFSLPSVQSLTAGDRSWFFASSALWLSLAPFWLLFPTARYLVHLIRGHF
jgi:hypothetical protein